MEPKKNEKYDVHRHRGLLLNVGLATSLAIIIMAFEWKSSVAPVKPRDLNAKNSDPVFVPPTESAYEIPKPLPRQTRQLIPEIIEPVPDDNAAATTDIPTVEPLVISSHGVMAIDIPVEAPTDEPFPWVEEMPEPEGGLPHFYSVLKKNMKYPNKAKHMGTEGRVYVQFVVNERGEPSDFQIAKGIGDGCDEEAIRVLKLIKWKPGKQRGVPVKVRMIQPVYFSFQSPR